MAITCTLAVILAAVAWNMRRKSSNQKKCEGHGKETKIISEMNGLGSAKQNLDAAPRSDDTIPELPDPKWVKVGQVQELYIYPLKSGRGRNLSDCSFTEFGICIEDKRKCTLRDR